MPKKRAILLLADGTRPDVFDELVADGELPNIARVFPEVSMRKSAVTVFPSTTGPAFLPFLTGRFPGPMNMPGIRWFDRAVWAERMRSGRNGKPAFRSYVGLETYRMNRDISPAFGTLFQLIPDSVNIFNCINRGVSRKGNPTRFSQTWWWGFGHETNRWDIVSTRSRKHLLRALDDDPQFVFCLVPDADNFAHLTHIRSEKTFKAYRRFDRTVGDLFRELERRGWRDDTLVMIVSDHGHSAVENHLGLPEWVRDEMGMRPFYYPKIWRKHFDSAVMVSGNGMAHIHLREGRTWTPARLPDEYLAEHHAELVGALLDRPEIAVVATQASDGTIIARSRSGTSAITPLPAGELRYTARDGDAFGYRRFDGVYHADDLLRLTVGTRYPDAPAQLAQLFASPRTGDIVVSAELGFDLRDKHEHPEHKSGHGALHADHMIVPWFSTAPLPDIPLRTADVFVTILRWIGVDIPNVIDGRSV